MRKSAIFEALIILASILIPVERVEAQVSYDQVTATVTDPDGHLLSDAPFSWVLVDSLGNRVSSATTPNGQIYNAASVRGNLSDAGTMSVQLVPNGILTKPSNTHWQLSITPPLPVDQSNILTYQPPWNLSYTTTISAPVDLSTQISAQTNRINYFNVQTGAATMAGWLVDVSDPPSRTCNASSHVGYFYMSAAKNAYQCNNAVGGVYQWNLISSTATLTGMGTIANIAALRGYNGTDTALNIVGYYSSTVTSQPDGGGGIFIDTGAAAIPPLTLTSVATQVSEATVYTGTITGGGSNAFAGKSFKVTGFSNPLNNGYYYALASTATTLTLWNVNGTAETHAATVTYNLTDDGGVNIYDSVTGHVWQRQIPTGGKISSLWFGTPRNYYACGSGPWAGGYCGTDATPNFQDWANYLCPGPSLNIGTSPTRNQGAGYIPGGLYAITRPITIACAPAIQGDGKQQQGFYQVMRSTIFAVGNSWTSDDDFFKYQGYTGSNFFGSSGLLDGVGFQFNGDDNTVSVNAVGMYSLWDGRSGQNLWRTGTQFAQGLISNNQFGPLTGAAIKYHVGKPHTVNGTFTGTFTASINNGSGGAGYQGCISAGTTPFQNAYLIGAGIPDYTYAFAVGAAETWCPVGVAFMTNQPVLATAESIDYGSTDAPLTQDIAIRDNSSVAVAQGIATDPFQGEEANRFILDHWNNESGISFSAGGVKSSFFDLQGMGAGVAVSHINYEGGAPANPSIFNLASISGLQLTDLYVESGSPGAPIKHIVHVEPPGGISGGISLNGIANESLITESMLDFGFGVCNIEANINDANVATVPLESGNTGCNSFRGNAVTPLDIGNLSNLLDTEQQLRGNPGSSGKINISVKQSSKVPFVDFHGGWLDGLTSGPVSVSFSNFTSEGIVTDSDEGRVFEVSNTGVVPRINISIANRTAMAGQQYLVSFRYKLETGSALNFCPLQGATHVSDENAGLASLSVPTNTQCSLAYKNAWGTAYGIYIPDGTGNITIQSSVLAGSPSGSQVLKVAGLYVGAGIEWPYTLGGGGTTQAFTWKAVTPPSFGTYIVGDTVVNSKYAPTEPERWIWTAPGLWQDVTPVSGATGSIKLATSPIGSAACQAVTPGSVNSLAVAGASSDDVLSFSPSKSLTGVTGWVPAVGGVLDIRGYTSNGYVNFDVCNYTSGSITPGAVILNWRTAHTLPPLLGKWPLDEGTTATTALDVSGNGNNGTWQGAQSCTGSYYTTGLAPLPYAGCFVSAAPNSITIGNISSLNFDTSQPFTVSTWVKTSFSGSARVFDAKVQTSGGSLVKGWYFYMSSAGKIGMQLASSFGTDQIGIESVAAVNDNSWHLAAVTYDGSGSVSGINLYIDGTLSNGTPSGATLSGSIANTGAFAIGAFGLATNTFDGDLEDDRVYGEALTATQLANVYAAGPNH